MTDEANITTIYTYDEMARLKSSVTGTATTHSAYNAADQLCWTGSTAGTCATPPAGITPLTYDANGNQTSGGNIWNSLNQMTSNGTDDYTYAAQQQRIDVQCGFELSQKAWILLASIEPLRTSAGAIL